MYWVRMHLEVNPFPLPAKLGSELTEKISGMKVCAHEPEPATLHTAANCPCTTTLGASSPAATSPAATSPVEEEQTPADGKSPDDGATGK